MYFLLAILLGCVFGIVCGLMPGIHPNTVAIILSTLIISGRLSFSNFSSTEIISFLISLLITNTFVDFVPSLLFSTPKEGTYLAVSPMQRYLKRGEGFLALTITTLSGLLSLTFFILFFPFFKLLLKIIYPVLYSYTPDILIAAIFLFLANSKRKLKETIIIAMLASVLGLEIFSLNISSTESIGCMLTGLFGFSSLIIGLFKKEKIAKQKLREIDVDMNPVLKGSVLSILGGIFSGIFPGITSTISAILVSTFVEMNESSFLSLLGGLNTINALMCICFFILYGKTRNGVVKIIKDTGLNINSLNLIFYIAFVSSLIGALVTLNIGKFMLRNISGIEIKKIYSPILILLLIIFYKLYGIFGILIVCSSTFLGILCENMDVKKSTLAFSLLIPVLKTYLFM